MSGDFTLVANVSLLFAELPLLERPAAAARAGFQAIELWWPFGANPSPARDEVDALLAAIEVGGIPLTGMNLFAGDMAAGERGVLSHPARAEEFRASLAVSERVAEVTGCRGFNALYGQRLDGVSAVEQDACADASLAIAIDRLGGMGGRLFIESLAEGLNGAYPLRTAEDAIAVVARARAATGTSAVGMLFDTFHLASNGDDLLGVIDRHAADLFHVQLADFPGRGEPGTGTIDFAAVLERLRQHGYDGVVAAEYRPAGATVDGLSWVAATPYLSLGGPEGAAGPAS